VVDAGLCHGAAGVGHLYHRLYRTTGVAGYAPVPPPGSESEVEKPPLIRMIPA